MHSINKYSKSEFNTYSLQCDWNNWENWDVNSYQRKSLDCMAWGYISMMYVNWVMK